jgi:putative CocE/NonD family hydrolase
VRVRLLGVGLIAALLLMVVPALASAKSAKLDKYHVQLLHVDVHIGPGHKTECNIIGQLYRPDSATKQHPAPAILTTNGFGGSYKSQAVPAAELAQNGYVVLSYSGLGFGGSSCRITLDSTVWDGAAASQLVTFLGGGLKATNGTRVNYVAKQKRASNGKRYKYDPVVGMVGGSYGGEVQFAAAAVDPRIDTIIPQITWNNLAYSLAPNNSSISGSSVTASVPGITKLTWLNIFWLAGEDATTPVAPFGGASSCSNFAADICPAYTNLTTDGFPDSATVSTIKDASVAYFMKKVKIPTLLMQGEFDTLFTLHEAVATYDGLRTQHTPVKMVWQSWGHSNNTVPLRGELGAGGGLYETTKDHKLTLEGNMILGWFNHYLKHQGPKPALNFSYYRPWVHYKGDAAAKAYSSANTYPVGKATSYYLSGGASLASSKTAASSGQSTFTTPTTTGPESVSDNPLITSKGEPVTISDPAGTFANYESAPLTSALNVVGVPTVTLTATAPPDQLAASGPTANTLGLYVKLEDISPNGTATLPDDLMAPVRIPDNGTPVKVYLPGIVHQFAKGDKLDLIVAGSDESYALANPDVTVTVSTSAGDPGVLSLPVVSKSAPVKLNAK